MTFIDKIRAFFHRFFLKRELKNHIFERENVNFEEAKSIGILFDATDINDHPSIENLRKSLKNQGKKIKVLGYINAKNANTMLSVDCFSKKDINWYLKPSPAATNDFINTKFDILINAYFTETLPLQYVSKLSKAKFRVGIYFPDDTNCSDLMLSVQEETPTLDGFFKELKHYLNIIVSNA